MKSSTFLQGFFWVAFAAFLGASIPHVAYFFRSYEPMAASLSFWDVVFWIISGFLAGSIDVMIFLLSKTVANMIRQKRSGGLILSVWGFIIGLTALSWFMNYKYAIQFRNTTMLSSTPVSLAGMTIPDINPILASSFLVLAISYTWIADKIANDAPPLTANQLKAQADELENVAIQQARIKAVKQQSSTPLDEKAAGVIKAGRSIWASLRSGEQKGQSEPSQNQQQPEEIPDTSLAVVEQAAPQEPETVLVVPEESVTEPIPTPIVAEPETTVVRSEPISEPLSPVIAIGRATQPLPLIIEGFNNRNTRYEFEGVTYDSLVKAVTYWNTGTFRYRAITDSDLKRVAKKPELSQYVQRVQCGSIVITTIALTNDAARSVYLAMGKPLPPALKLTAPVSQA